MTDIDAAEQIIAGDLDGIARAAQAAAGELFVQFLFSRATAEDVQMVSRMEEQLLTQVPVWRFLNRGDDFSAQICHDGLEMEAQL